MSTIAANPVEAVEGAIRPLGRNPQNIKIYFPALGELSLSGTSSTWSGFDPFMTQEEVWDANEIAAIMGALADIEALIDVNFSITNNRAAADLDFIKNDDSDGISRFHNLEVTEGGQIHRLGSVVINHTITSDLPWHTPWAGGYDPGTAGYQTLLSAIGGALGLGYTHNDANGSKILPGLSQDNRFSFGPDWINDSINSVMAQGLGFAFHSTVFFQSGARSTMGAWDIEALQNIYGAKTGTNSGDDIYQIDHNPVFGEPATYKTIYDTGGIDWIKADDFRDSQLDMRPATLDFERSTSGGGISFSLDAVGAPDVDGFTIAAGTIIENAEGGFGDDTIIGNQWDNYILGQQGRDLIFGGLGDDTLNGGEDRDEYAGTLAELNGDTIEDISGNDRVFVYGVHYDVADLSVVQSGGVTKLVADNGTPSERLEMILDAGIGLAPSAYNLFALKRGPDTMITFAQEDDLPDTVADASVGDPLFGPETFFPRETGFAPEYVGIEYGIIETAGDKDVIAIYDNYFIDKIIDVRGLSAGGGSLATPTIELFDGTGALIDSDTASGPSGAARIVIPGDSSLSDSRDYYIAISGGAGETGSYTIRGVEADDHPDTTFSTFFFIGDQTYLGPQNSPHRAELELAGDKDFYAVELAGGVTYSFSTTGLENYYGELTDTKITLRDSAGAQIAVNNNGGPGNDARLTYTPASDMEVFLDIAAGTTNASRSLGQYEVSVAVGDDLPDQPFDAALYPIGAGPIGGAIEQWGDLDYLAFWLEAGQSYDFEAISGMATGSMDILLPSGAVALNFGMNSPLFAFPTSYTATETGIHYIKAFTAYGVTVGTYTLEVTTSGGGAGNQVIGTGGDDSLNGAGAAEVISGLAGADVIDGRGGADTISGGRGDDEIDGGPGHDRISGQTGSDTLRGGDGSDSLLGDQNDDLLEGGDGSDTLLGGADDDTLFGDGQADGLFGQSGDDVLRGGPGADTLDGGRGNDLLSGNNDNDSMSGATGLDTLFGQGGNDTLDGGDGADLLFGGAGLDILAGGDGDDELLGQGDADSLTGGQGGDTLRGGSGNDTLDGGGSHDALYGNGNNDLMLGGAGNDLLQGAAGLDMLEGGAGRDTLTGGDGADSLDGGTGDDVMNGGANADRFVFRLGYGADRINGYEQGTDRLVLDDALWSGALSGQQVVDLFGSLNGTGTILTVDFGGGDVLEIQSSGGINAASLGGDVLII